MTTPHAVRPLDTEFAPYYDRYVSRVPEGDVVGTLETQLAETLAVLRAIPESRGTHRYAPDKWTIKQVVAHLSDTERIFAYRALRIARGDATPLPGFDENAYAEGADFDRIPLAALIDELEAVRRATVHLFRHMDGTALGRRGSANGQPVTARALAFITAGHERHHLAILRERYL
jgi:hypothetical protein